MATLHRNIILSVLLAALCLFATVRARDFSMLLRAAGHGDHEHEHGGHIQPSTCARRKDSHNYPCGCSNGLCWTGNRTHWCNSGASMGHCTPCVRNTDCFRTTCCSKLHTYHWNDWNEKIEACKKFNRECSSQKGIRSLIIVILVCIALCYGTIARHFSLPASAYRSVTGERWRMSCLPHGMDSCSATRTSKLWLL